MEGVIDIVFSLLEFLQITIYRNIIFGDEIFKYFKYSIILGLIGGLINYIIPVNLGYIAFILLFMLHVTSFAMVSKNRILNSFIEIVLGTLAVIIVQTGALVLNNIIFDGNEKVFLLINILLQVAAIIFLYRKNNFFDKYRKIIKGNYSVSLLGLNCLLVFVIIKILYDNLALNRSLIFIVMGLFIIFLISAVYLWKRIIKEEKEKQRLELENEFKPILERYLDEMRAKEHEYKNHLNTLYMMLEVGEEKEVKGKISEYIEKLNSDRVIEKILHVKNTFVKAILYTSICKAKNAGIEIDFSITSDFMDIKVDDTELVIILGNLLNNAIDAAERSIEKKVYLNIYTSYMEEQAIHHIIVENTLNKEYVFDIVQATNKGYSTKGENRGYGLYNINNIIKSLNGKLLVERQNDRISIEAII
ncbi:MAG: sensor histidine kinase [Sarcina sp.]